MKKSDIVIIPEEVIMSKILIIRGIKVMVDSDLAELYEVPTKRLNEQVKRNLQKFPGDFMFQLTEEEKQEVVANCDHLKRLKYSTSLPFAFTEHGAIMLASVLNNDRAILVNIEIVRVYIKMRQLIETHSEILRKLEQIDKKDIEQDKQIMLIFEYLRQLDHAKHQQDKQAKRNKIGFRQGD